MKSVGLADRRLFRVTAGNLRQGHLYLNGHYDFFPKDCVGPSRKAQMANGRLIEIHLDGLGKTVRTDIGVDSATGSPRRFFRGRSWVRQFYQFHGVRPGDVLIMEKTAHGEYRLTPLRGDGCWHGLTCSSEPHGMDPSSSGWKSIELFVGAGGLALGTARAGLHHLAVLESDTNACDTLRANKALGVAHVRDWEIVQGDVRQYPYSRHEGEVEFVTGGPPCQPFSIGGKHRGQADDRNLFPEAARAIREIRPRAFILENVKGLLRRSFSNYYTYIIRRLEFPEIVPRGDEEWIDHLARLEQVYTSGAYDGLRYQVVFQLLNAADFGVPQRRERVLIVGIRSDLGIHFSFPQATHTEDALLHDKWVSGLYWDRHRIPRGKRPRMPKSVSGRVERLRCEMRELMGEPWRTVRDAIHDLPRLAVGHTSTKAANHFLNPGARIYQGHTGSPLDEPAKALKAGDHGVPGGENMLRKDDGSVRYFSVRECARLQTFPDDWVFQGAWTEAMRQLGNAVPVQLAEAVARHLANALRVPEHSRRRRSDCGD